MATPFDPNDTAVYDSILLEVVTPEKSAARKKRDNKTVLIFAIIVILIGVAVTFGGIAIGDHTEATFAASETRPVTRLVYVSPSVTIWVQRVNPTHPEVDFSIIVASTDAHHITHTYTFVMSDDPPADGRTYVLHCTYNGRFFLIAADLFLDHPMIGTQFNGAGTLYLTLGRQGKYLLRMP